MVGIEKTMMHKCKRVVAKDITIWKIFDSHWRMIKPRDKNGQLSLTKTYSNGERINKCPECKKVLT